MLNGNEAGPPPRFNTSKGKTLSTWMNYVLCGAQQKAGELGYSPLPKNLVVGGFQQIDHVPGHVPTPDLKQLNGCNNPTYSDGVNHLIVDAPHALPCDKIGQPLTCGTGAPAPTVGSQSTANNSGGASVPGATQTTAPAGGKHGKQPTSAALGAPSPARRRRPTPTPASRSARRRAPMPLRWPPCQSPCRQPSQSKNWLLPMLTALDIVAAVALPGIC